MRTSSPRSIGKEHPLVLALVAGGCTYREAHQIINALFDSIKDALKRHEEVELPFGTLKVVPNTVKPYRRWFKGNWGNKQPGRPVAFYQKRFRVELVPHEKE